MKKSLVASVCAVILVSPLLVIAQDQNTVYYPLKLGSKWTYKAGDKTIVLHLKEFEDVDGVKCAVMETSTEGQGKKFTEHVAVKKDGVYRFKAQGLKIDPPLLFLKLPAKDGNKWKIKSKMGDTLLEGTGKSSQAKATVPAGVFKCIVSTVTVSQDLQSFSTKFLFARDIGIVKQQVNFGNTEVIIELQKYEPGKGKN